jgi:hypothetical protein
MFSSQPALPWKYAPPALPGDIYLSCIRRRPVANFKELQDLRWDKACPRGVQMPVAIISLRMRKKTRARGHCEKNHFSLDASGIGWLAVYSEPDLGRFWQHEAAAVPIVEPQVCTQIAFCVMIVTS